VRRSLVAVGVLATAVVMTVSACSSSNSKDKNTGGASKSGGNGGGNSLLSTDGAGKTINVWLQSDAQKGWPDVVNQANQRFEQLTGAKVKVQWQQWANYTGKLDSTFAGSSGIPDVVELGNTQTASYIAGGAFADLTSAKSEFENSATWLKGLADSGTSPDGKLQAIPYYAGSRVVIYRKDLWTKAGVTTAPTTLDELFSDLDKVKAANKKDPNFSSFYTPGKNWYAGMSFVYGAGGSIATQDGGKWKGGLSAPEAQTGLQQWQRLATDYSVGGATKDEADQDAIMSQGHVAAILGNGWELGSVLDPKTGNPALKSKLATFPLPGSAAGKYTPSFLGGSDLAVPDKSSNKGLGAEWLKIFTDTASQTALAKFAIPNTTSLLNVYEAQAEANKSTGEAAKDTWFVPNTPNWANVESNNILQNALESIATKKSSVADAAKSADEQIAKTLNAGS
jgi:N,N'-diacetylchitobiose transport system substrate-binding protein